MQENNFNNIQNQPYYIQQQPQFQIPTAGAQPVAAPVSQIMPNSVIPTQQQSLYQMPRGEIYNPQYQTPVPPAQYYMPKQSPNAVNINIYSPTAYSGDNQQYSCNPITPNTLANPYAYNSYPAYSTMPYAQGTPYPQNYNNLINYPQPNNSNSLNFMPDNNGLNKVPTQNGNNLNRNETNIDRQNVKEEGKSKKEEKEIIPLTDDYIKSLENYLNSNSTKVRMSGIKSVLDRFKEDESRKDNPCLIPLLNKALQDTSPSVRFLALTAIQLGYTKGDDKTVEILNNLVANSKNNFGEDASMASDALLKIATPEAVKVKGGN